MSSFQLCSKFSLSLGPSLSGVPVPAGEGMARRALTARTSALSVVLTRSFQSEPHPVQVQAGGVGGHGADRTHAAGGVRKFPWAMARLAALGLHHGRASFKKNGWGCPGGFGP